MIHFFSVWLASYLEEVAIEDKGLVYNIFVTPAENTGSRRWILIPSLTLFEHSRCYKDVILVLPFGRRPLNKTEIISRKQEYILSFNERTGYEPNPHPHTHTHYCLNRLMYKQFAVGKKMNKISTCRTIILSRGP